MSEEEKKAIKYIKEFKNEVFEGVGNKSIMAKNIDILLNLIEKQQKEIETYKNEIKLQGYVTVDYIHKDKIRAKIKEIREWDKEIGQENSWLSPYQIKVLEELLEEN